jgi:type II secretory pathway component PulJ
MRTKDIILVAVAVVAILLFAAFMFVDHRQSEKNKMLREYIQNDSLIMLKQQDFMYRDSMIIKDLDNQEYRLYKLERLHRRKLHGKQ